MDVLKTSHKLVSLEVSHNISPTSHKISHKVSHKISHKVSHKISHTSHKIYHKIRHQVRMRKHLGRLLPPHCPSIALPQINVLDDILFHVFVIYLCLCKRQGPFYMSLRDSLSPKYRGFQKGFYTGLNDRTCSFNDTEDSS